MRGLRGEGSETMRGARGVVKESTNSSAPLTHSLMLFLVLAKFVGSSSYVSLSRSLAWSILASYIFVFRACI